MNEFYQGLIAGIGMLGGLCAFNYWVFNLMEKRLESKLDVVVQDVHSIVLEMKEQRHELREQRKDMDRIYLFVLEAVKK